MLILVVKTELRERNDFVRGCATRENMFFSDHLLKENIQSYTNIQQRSPVSCELLGVVFMKRFYIKLKKNNGYV